MPDDNESPLLPPFDRHPSSEGSGDSDAIARRDFLRIAGVGAGVLLTTGCASGGTFASAQPVAGIERKGPRDKGVGHVVVIGAGVWGGWTAYHLRERGARVTLIDAYGPGNSRSTSGDESRGVRSSYGDRAVGNLWVPWARASIERWSLFEKEWGPVFKTKFFHQTGDVIMRATEEPFITKTLELWKANKVRHEVLSGDEARKRWPVIDARDITIAITEPDAGVVRARASTQAIASIGQQMGVKLIISRARLGEIRGGQLQGVILEDGTVVRGDAYVFACGPWLRKLFPYLDNRMRVPLGYVCYFGVPVADARFTYPNLPSFNFPGVTGWPMLPTDSRGFRVRGAIAPPAAPGTTPAAGAGAGAGAAGAGAAAAASGAGATGAGAAGAGAAGAGAAGAGATGAGRGAAGAAGNTGAGGAGRGAAGAGGGAGGRGGRDGGAGGGANRPPAAPVDPVQQDPDTSSRWATQDRIDGSRRFLAARFPLLANAPLLETRACHYESSVNGNFIIDHVPDTSNAWIAGVGQAEGFKFAPVVGEYVAQRVLGNPGDPKLVTAFKLPTEEYEAVTPPR